MVLLGVVGLVEGWHHEGFTPNIIIAAAFFFVLIVLPIAAFYLVCWQHDWRLTGDG